MSATRTTPGPIDGGEQPETVSGCRILVVDDHEMVRFGLHALLTAQPWVERCIGAGTFDRALEIAGRYRPQLALVDLFVGSESGIGFCRTLLSISPNTNVVLMSGTGSVSAPVARAAGACAFVPKDWPVRTLLEAMERAREGRRTFPRDGRSHPATRLTRREQDVLSHLVQGLSNTQIAEQLHLSHHTVKDYTRALYRKLEVSGRVEAAGRARQLGLVR